jgi:hypothetical protein
MAFAHLLLHCFQLEPDQHGNINYVEYVNMMMSE